MSEFINKEQLKSALKVVDIGIWSDIADIVDSLPSADVAPVVHGHWKEGSDDGIWWTYLKCSVCEGEGYNNYRFCPHCGAKMDESEGKNDV